MREINSVKASFIEIIMVKMLMEQKGEAAMFFDVCVLWCLS
jgi:hypothetical protein